MVRRGRWRPRFARWPSSAPAPAEPPAAAQAGAPLDAWAEACEQFAWRLLVLTEQLRPVLDGLESGEDDADRLAALYQVDHGVTRMRQVARDLRVLANRGGEDVAGHTTSLLDVIRMAASAIEHYGRLSIGPVADLAVVAYAADDVASVLAALADNATRYSPTTVRVSAHLLADGSVMLRVEDAGLGIEPGLLAALNKTLDDPVPAEHAVNGRHTGFTVVHRLARRHGLRVQIARRQPPGRSATADMSGTIAMVVVPASLLCEIPDLPPAVGRRARDRSTPAVAPAPPPPASLPATTDPVHPSVPPRDRPAQETATALPRREPRSVRTPARQARVAAEQGDIPSPAAEGFAFAADLRAFNAGLSAGGATGAERDERRAVDTEGHMP